MSKDLNITKNLKKFINYKNGFFLEVGGHDGLFQSNSIYYEKELNWDGILIEPSFENYLKCLSNRPNIRSFNFALSSDDYLKENKSILLEDNNSPMAKVKSNNFLNIFFRKNYVNVNVISLNKLLKILNISEIDLFVLDVEGFELNVLQGIKFEEIKIKFICVEVWDSQKKKIFNFMDSKNYQLIANLSEFNKIDFPNWSGNHNDYLFKKIK